MTSVSVIVPCLNEEQTIDLLLDAIYQQTYPREKVEVVIADGMSEDNTRKVIEEYSYSHNDLDIRIINNIKKNIPSGLNEAITESTGEIIVRMDAHSIPSENYIERAVANLQAQKGDNIGGRWIILPGADRWISRSIAIAASHPLAVGGVSYRIGGSAQAVDTVPFGSFRRELFDQIGLFDENLLSNEDYDFNTRIRKNGGTVWFDPEMKTKYFARSTLGQLAKQYWRYGYWKFKMLKKYPDSLRLRQGIPPLFILSLVILAIISFFYPIFGILLFIEIGIYVTTLLFVGMINAAKAKKLPHMIGVPLSITIMHFAWGSGFLYSALRSATKEKL